MIRSNIPCDPAIHRVACEIANRITDMLAGILMDAEKGECRRESYLICREILEEMNKGK